MKAGKKKTFAGRYVTRRACTIIIVSPAARRPAYRTRHTVFSPYEPPPPPPSSRHRQYWPAGVPRACDTDTDSAAGSVRVVRAPSRCQSGSTNVNTAPRSPQTPSRSSPSRPVVPKVVFTRVSCAAAATAGRPAKRTRTVTTAAGATFSSSPFSIQ